MFNAVAVALIALPFVAQSVLAGDCVRSYKIVEGDICDSISAANNVSTYQLATINEGYIDAACSNLEPDATICIGYDGEDCDQTYVVAPNDTCAGIIASNGIDETTFYNNNPNIDADCLNIYIGEVLAVCPTVIIPPAGTSLVATAIPSTATAAVSATEPATTFSVAAATTSSSSSFSAAVTSADTTTSTTAAAAFVATTTSSAAASSSSAAYDDSGDEDDDSLPYCDEL